MAGMDWFRWHHGSVTDPKFQLVARKTKCRVSDVIAVWAFLLEAASQADDRGNPGQQDFEAIDCALGLDDGQAQAIHGAMIDRGVVVADGRIAAWEKRQPKREREDDKSTERVKAFREKKRQETQSNASETPCNATKRLEERRVEERRVEESRVDKTDIKDDSSTPSREAGICVVMKSMGIGSVNPQHPKLATLLADGATVADFESAARIAVEGGKGFAYALGVVEGIRADAKRQPKPIIETFRERDSRLEAERMAEFAPGVARKTGLNSVQNFSKTIDAEVKNVTAIASR